MIVMQDAMPAVCGKGMRTSLFFLGVAAQTAQQLVENIDLLIPGARPYVDLMIPSPGWMACGIPELCPCRHPPRPKAWQPTSPASPVSYNRRLMVPPPNSHTTDPAAQAPAALPPSPSFLSP